MNPSQQSIISITMSQVNRITKTEEIKGGPQIFQVHPWAERGDGIGGFMCPGAGCGAWSSPEDLNQLVTCGYCRTVYAIPPAEIPSEAELITGEHNSGL